jgi:hypothetical protein
MMRSYQIFAAMPPDRAAAVMSGLSESAPQMFKQALFAASASMNARPIYLSKQPFEKQVGAVRRALSRVAANGVAEEHEDGILEANSPAAPAKAELRKARDSFCGADDDADRPLLVQAFAAQSAIDWPDLEALLDR